MVKPSILLLVAFSVVMTQGIPLDSRYKHDDVDGTTTTKGRPVDAAKLQEITHCISDSDRSCDASPGDRQDLERRQLPQGTEPVNTFIRQNGGFNHLLDGLIGGRTAPRRGSRLGGRPGGGPGGGPLGGPGGRPGGGPGGRPGGRPVAPNTPPA